MNMRVCATGLLGVCSYICAVEDCCEGVRRSKVGMTKERSVNGVHGAGRGARGLSVWAYCARLGKRSDWTNDGSPPETVLNIRSW